MHKGCRAHWNDLLRTLLLGSEACAESLCEIILFIIKGAVLE